MRITIPLIPIIVNKITTPIASSPTDRIHVPYLSYDLYDINNTIMKIIDNKTKTSIIPKFKY